MGCLLLGFLVCRLGVVVVSAGKEKKMNVRVCRLVTQWNEFLSRD